MVDAVRIFSLIYISKCSKFRLSTLPKSKLIFAEYMHTGTRSRGLVHVNL
jgi:hypothetical protein